MNPIRKRPFRAALFLSLILLGLSSCEKPEQSVGLDVQPEDDLINLFVVDTLSIDAATVKEDSLRTDELSINLAGNYIDPVLGSVQSSFATHLRLPTNNVDFGNVADLVVDSVVLSLVYEGSVYGNLNDQTWVVNEIIEELFVDSTYYSNRNFSLGPDLVAEGFATQSINLDSTVTIDDEELAPQLRIRLDNDFADRIFAESGNTGLSNNDEFVQFFKGIQISSETADAGVIRFSTLDNESKVAIHYRNTVEEDTLSFVLNINADCARINHFEMDYAGTDLTGIEDNDIDGAAQTFIQAGGGVKTRLRFPSLGDLNQFDQRTLNSAILYMPIASMDLDDFEPQSSLFALTLNADGESSAIPDQLLGPSHIGGEYDVENNRYQFNITRFCQAILDGIQDSGDLFLVSNSAGVTVRRVGLYGPNAFPEDSDQNMEIVVTFSN